MNKTTMTLVAVVALTAVFALASPFDVAVAQTTDVIPDGEGGEYKDGEHKEGKSCPFKERKLQQSAEQSS